MNQQLFIKYPPNLKLYQIKFFNFTVYYDFNDFFEIFF